MSDRLLLLLTIAALVVAGVAATRLVVAWRTRRLAAAPSKPLWSALRMQPDGRATVVAFSTPSCAACHTAQSPALDALAERLGEQRLRVVRVNAAEDPDVARAFGVLTVPSTAVLDGQGSLVAVNQGFAHTNRLARQVGQTH